MSHSGGRNSSRDGLRAENRALRRQIVDLHDAIEDIADEFELLLANQQEVSSNLGNAANLLNRARTVGKVEKDNGDNGVDNKAKTKAKGGEEPTKPKRDAKAKEGGEEPPKRDAKAKEGGEETTKPKRDAKAKEGGEEPTKPKRDAKAKEGGEEPPKRDAKAKEGGEEPPKRDAKAKGGEETTSRKMQRLFLLLQLLSTKPSTPWILTQHVLPLALAIRMLADVVCGSDVR